MKTSTLLLAPLLAQSSLAAVAVFASVTAGGTAGVTYDAWYWDGGLVDDWWNHSPKTYCRMAGHFDSSCELSGYKVTLHNVNTNGCKSAEHVQSATIENSKGESMEVGPDTCREIRSCSKAGGFGGSSTNGYQCDF